MPYNRTADLPPAVRKHLPGHAQEIFLAAFNNAFQSHEGDPHQDQIAFRIAWAAVKRSYMKVGGNWIPKDPGILPG